MGTVQRAKRISTDLEPDIKEITEIYLKAGYPKLFLQATLNNFCKQTGKEKRLIPEYMFEERKKVFIKLPNSQDNEKLSKRFINKLNIHVHFMFIILWETRKIKSLFNLKDKNWHKSNVITYRVACKCGETYIGETKRNFAERKAEHENKTHNSEPARHLAKNPDYITHKEHCVYGKNNFSTQNNGRPVDCLRETNIEQTGALFYRQTVPLGEYTKPS